MPIQESSVSFYQTNTCKISFLQYLSNDFKNFDFEIIADKNSDVECHGKINGADLINDTIKVYIGTNHLIDLIVQSLFFVLCIFLIPKTKKKNEFRYRNFNIIFLMFLGYLHLLGENEYYKFYSKTFDLSLNFKNYYLLTFLIFLYFILNLLFDVLETRGSNLINFFPFMFLIVGTFNSLNLNFFLFVFMPYGIQCILEKSVPKKTSLYYMLFSMIIIYQYSNKKVWIFDVDKLKGFSNSSSSIESIIFWLITYYLVLIGINFIINTYKDLLNLNVIKNNFLITGALISAFGIFASFIPSINFYLYYYLGLNKPGMKSFSSIDGNTWRGLSSSAESLGEFYAYSTLFVIILTLMNKTKLTKLNYLSLFIIFYGIWRANNFAAISMLFISTTFFLINNNFKISKKLIITIFVLSILTISIGVYYYNPYSKEFLSKSLIQYGLENSQINYNFKKNEFGQTAVDKLNFVEILKIDKKESNISNSLYYLISKYNDENNINFIPSPTTLAGTIAVLINRSEKWGIFLAKYNPSRTELLWGYGPNQLSKYYHSHLTQVNDGLVLPHSSILVFIIFFGIIGLSVFLIYLIYLVKKYKHNKLFIYLITFLLINFLKSDSILYLNSFVLFFFTMNIHKFEYINYD